MVAVSSDLDVYLRHCAYLRSFVYLLLSEHTLVFHKPTVTLMYYFNYELLDEVEQNMVVLSVARRRRPSSIIVSSISYKTSLKTL